MVAFQICQELPISFKLISFQPFLIKTFPNLPDEETWAANKSAVEASSSMPLQLN